MKISFSKLVTLKGKDPKIIQINNQDVEVLQYLPANDKLKLVSRIIEKTLNADKNHYSNPIKSDVFGNIELIKAYTNISFTAKQEESPDKLYDLLELNGIIDDVIQAIPREEYVTIVECVNECTENICKHNESALGILETISTDYKDVNMDVESLTQQLSDPENMGLLRDVLNKMG